LPRSSRSQGTYAPSLRSGEIATVAPFRYAGMVWAVVFGVLLWNELPDAYSFAGILILMSAGLYTFYREQKLRRLSQARTPNTRT
jgi:drug/metabolite transporter (DMT)-like permease